MAFIPIQGSCASGNQWLYFIHSMHLSTCHPCHTQVSNSIGLALILMAWSVTEIIRYAYYAFSLFGANLYALTWCRYVCSDWIECACILVGGELFQIRVHSLYSMLGSMEFIWIYCDLCGWIKGIIHAIYCIFVQLSITFILNGHYRNNRT